LSVVYIALSSSVALVEDHRIWKDFIQVSQARHLLRMDNFGLPTLLARLGLDPRQGLLILLAPLCLSFGVFAYSKLKPNPPFYIRGFLWIHLATLIFSPMCWRQNFVVLLPLAWELAETFGTSRGRAKVRVTLGLGALFLIGRVSDYWVSKDLQVLWSTWALPSFLGLFALLMLPTHSERRAPS